jgi:hypothetical protein
MVGRRGRAAGLPCYDKSCAVGGIRPLLRSLVCVVDYGPRVATRGYYLPAALRLLTPGASHGASIQEMRVSFDAGG